jgi:uncharacterized protein (TIGR00369 family)
MEKTEMWKAADEGFERRVRDSFARQRVMGLIGTRLTRIDPGMVEIEVPMRDDLTQQDGFMHAGIVTTALDSACGYAAYTLMPEGSGVLSVEFKVNLLSPATGDLIKAVAEVKRAGRTLTVVSADAWAGEKLVATMLGTMMTVGRKKA